MLRKEGQTVMFVAIDGRLAGIVAVADPVKESALDAIAQLKQEGIKVIMVTGDNHTTAAAVAKKLGIEFEADVLPDKKAEVVRRLQSQGAAGIDRPQRATKWLRTPRQAGCRLR